MSKSLEHEWIRIGGPRSWHWECKNCGLSHIYENIHKACPKGLDKLHNGGYDVRIPKTI